MAAITRLGAYGGPRGLYGSFAGKTEEIVVDAQVQFGKKFYAGKARLQDEIAANIAREDEEIVMIINIVGKYLL